jgi:hypothetical protein
MAGAGPAFRSALLADGGGIDPHDPAMKPLVIVAEYDALRPALGAGLYVLPDSADLRVWHGAVMGRGQQSRYAGGVFRFVIGIPPCYPADGAVSRPVVVFIDRPFHPLVDPATGALALEARFPSWAPPSWAPPAPAEGDRVGDLDPAPAGSPAECTLASLAAYVRSLVQAQELPPIPAPGARLPNAEAARLYVRLRSGSAAATIGVLGVGLGQCM